MNEEYTLLFVDDDPTAGELLQRFCEGTPYKSQIFHDPREALGFFTEHGADVIITDLQMPGMNGMELLGEIRAKDCEVPVIIITAHTTINNAIEALRLGANDFLKKPFDMEELLLLVDKTMERTQLRRENRILRTQLEDEKNTQDIIGNSSALQEVFHTIKKVADVRCSVIIEGESGTGKELAARAIHNLSQVSDRPFVIIDCGALSGTLLESELFGHEKGAFTGATSAKEGLLQVATGGTVFLDEIGNISDAMQVKLLRAIQEQQITRVGGVKPIDIDVRFVVASNQILEDMVKEGRFRADLFHRINVVKIVMPPLRERPEDIPLLIKHFVNLFAGRYNREITGFDSASIKKLEQYAWPGNVRELRNLVEHHVVLADGSELSVGPLPETSQPADLLDDDFPTLAELEQRYVKKVMGRFDGNRKMVAEALGIDKSTLWRKLQQYE
ncbi:MAG: sigma-54-dependent Fis family transcriptional regulator [Gammaproteobacteria bacterium]|nr:sigma-54-dependent Fis family transcriptional regulator [Gammaproteobacteria bacterium]